MSSIVSSLASEAKVLPSRQAHGPHQPSTLGSPRDDVPPFAGLLDSDPPLPSRSNTPAKSKSRQQTRPSDKTDTSYIAARSGAAPRTRDAAAPRNADDKVETKNGTETASTSKDADAGPSEETSSDDKVTASADPSLITSAETPPASTPAVLSHVIAVVLPPAASAASAQASTEAEIPFADTTPGPASPADGTAPQAADDVIPDDVITAAASKASPAASGRPHAANIEQSVNGKATEKSSDTGTKTDNPDHDKLVEGHRNIARGEIEDRAGAKVENAADLLRTTGPDQQTAHHAQVDATVAAPKANTDPVQAAALFAPSGQPAAASHTAQLTTGPAIALNGVAVEIITQARAGKNHFEIRLDPPELGRIDVRLDIDRHGHVTSRLIVERAETLDLLRRDAVGLERALQDAGLKTSDNGLQFSLRDQGFAGNNSNSRDSLPGAARLIVSDEQSAVTDTSRRDYGHMLRLGDGIDISV